ncbi:MAG: DNA polymerase III subunit delta [Salinisphaera sp.]|nr:DNA polymerase III subunit delta [Salinisphaera sp.]
MPLKPEQLPAHIDRNGLAPVILLAGEEPLLLHEAAQALRKSARAAGFDERQVLHAQAGFDWSELAAAGGSLSLFSQKRLLELHLGDKGPGVDGSKAIQAHAADPPPDTLLIVHGGRLDAAQRRSAWFRAVERAGVAVYAWPLPTDALPAWIETRARQRGLALDADTLALLSSQVEGNLLAADQEIRRLTLLFPEGRPDLAAVRAACADAARFDIFDLPAKALAGDRAGVVRAVTRLREAGTDPVPILWALVRDLRLLARAGVAAPGRGGARSVLDAPGLRMPPAHKRLLAAAAQRQRPGRALALLRQAGQADRVCKGAAPGLAWEELITLALGLAGAHAPASTRPNRQRSR